MPKNCKNCGAEMPEEAHFCLSCLTETEEKTIITTNDRSSFFTNKKRALAFITMALLIIALILICIFYFGNKNPNPVNDEENKTAISTVTQDDGSVITEYDDGSVETVEPDGTTVVEEKDDTVITKRTDGTVITETPDKTVITSQIEKTTITETTAQNINAEISSTHPVPANSWSDWTTEKPKEGTYTNLEQKTQFRYRDKIISTGSSNTMDGWQLYDVSYYWSDYGDWSNWSVNCYSSNDSRQIESRTVYRFCAFKCTKCGNRDPYRTPCDNCKTSEYFVWEEYWYPTKGYSMDKKEMSTVPDKYYVTINGKRWWFEKDGYSDGQGGIGQPSRQEYRYRDREQIATYYFYKWNDWSEWTENPIDNSDTREVESRTLYRYK